MSTVSTSLNDSKIKEIFDAQIANTKELEKAWKHINKDINQAYIKGQESAVKYEIKLMALVYCALAEAIFSKLIHTPSGFSPDEITQIKNKSNNDGVKAGWIKCLELALAKVNSQKSNHVHNVKKKISSFIDNYIYDPSVLRNKIAHGQWVKALNRDNTSINDDYTKEIENLEILVLYRRKEALVTLSILLEDIIKSPDKAHHRDYWTHLVNLEKKQISMAAWTIENKIAQLKKKKEYTL